MAKNTTKMPKFFSPKFQQSYTSYWGIREEEQICGETPNNSKI
jgi:hypothetical protein